MFCFVIGQQNLSAQSSQLSKVRIYAKSALKEYIDDYHGYRLKKIHNVVIEDWNFNSHTGRFIIIFNAKWEDIGDFFDDTYEGTYTLKCDDNSCNATFKKETSDRKYELECLEY
jgi:hypothetical protein